MGKVVEWDDPRFEGLLKRMGKERIDGARAIILLDVFKVCTAPPHRQSQVRIPIVEKNRVGANVLWFRCSFLDHGIYVGG